MNCKLTISILASNRKDTLPRTLESIKPILDNVSSELIVTDTGCDEELVSHIRKYTDKIIKYTWNDDFSEARNVGLNAAQGEWFMFIDDDEWFEDVTPIIEFFNKEDDGTYNKLQYMVRNYHTRDGEKWSEMMVDRGFRTGDGVKFIEPVHEHVNINGGTVKRFYCFAHHYGYAFNSLEEKKKHSMRNIPLIKKQLETNLTDSRMYAQLLQEYNSIEEYEKAFAYAEMALECVDFENKSNRRHISGFLAEKVFATQQMGDMKGAIKYAYEALEYKDLSNTGKAYIYMYLNGACMENGDKDNALYYGEKYLRTMDFLNENKNIRYDEETVLVGEVFNEEIFFKVFYIALETAAMKQDEEICLYIMSHADPNRKIQYLDNGLWILDLAKLMLKSEHKELYGDTFKMFMKK